MAETTCLLNMRTRKGTGGSNPPLSAQNIRGVAPPLRTTSEDEAVRLHRTKLNDSIESDKQFLL